MLVMNRMNMDLRNYLQQNHNQLTWKERIQIADDIIDALDSIHNENAIHRDLTFWKFIIFTVKSAILCQ